MNYLPAADIARLRTLFATSPWSGYDDATRFATVNAPTTVNNSAAPQIPITMSESGLAALLTDPNNGSLAKLLNWVNFGLVKADIDGQNTVGVGLWADKLQLLGIVTAGEATAIKAYAASTQAQPGWPAQVATGPSPLATVFGSGKTWTGPDGSVVNFVPLPDIQAAR